MAKVNYGAILCAESDRIKNFDDFWYFFGPRRDHCDVGITSYADIASKPSCDGKISDLYDITGVEYYELCGKHICELPYADHLEKNELLLLTRYVNASTLSSMNTSYGQLSSQMFMDVLCGLHVHTMAYEPKYRYAISSHNHDHAYSRVTYQGNSMNTDDVSVIGNLAISTDALPAGCQYDNVNHNPSKKYKPMPSIVHNINIPKVHVLFPPRPMIGTIKLVGLQTIQKLIDSNSLLVDSTSHQVNPYDSSNMIRHTYDGWVFANGTTITNHTSQLSDASQIYNGNNTGDITIPELTSFFKCNPYVITTNSIQGHDYSNACVPHSHYIQSMNCNASLAINNVLMPMEKTKSRAAYEWKNISADCSDSLKVLLEKENYFNDTKANACNWKKNSKHSEYTLETTVDASTIKISGITINQNDAVDGEPYPTHNIVPVMIYIGGETRDYYEYIYEKYHGKIF